MYAALQAFEEALCNDGETEPFLLMIADGTSFLREREKKKRPTSFSRVNFSCDFEQIP